MNNSYAADDRQLTSSRVRLVLRRHQLCQLDAQQVNDPRISAQDCKS
jgi:hypothetical protein